MAIVLDATAKALTFCNKASDELTNQQTHSVTSLAVPQVYDPGGFYTVHNGLYSPSLLDSIARRGGFFDQVIR